MFNFFKKSAPVERGPSSPDKLAAVCAPRRWTFCPDRGSVAAQGEVSQWIPPAVAFSLGRSQGSMVEEDEGCNFIFGNELGLKFCVCEVSRGAGTMLNVYVARNWKKLPDLSVTALTADARPPAQSLFAQGSRLTRAYAFDAADGPAAAAVFTPQVESLMGKRKWNLLVRGEWFTCNAGSRMAPDMLDTFVMESTQLMMALPQGR